VHTIHPDDDFFALGGHSLKVFRLLAEIENSFDVSLRATSVFGSATIRTMANRIRDEQEREVWTI
jgi:acyl carrier protein